MSERVREMRGAQPRGIRGAPGTGVIAAFFGAALCAGVYHTPAFGAASPGAAVESPAAPAKPAFISTVPSAESADRPGAPAAPPAPPEPSASSAPSSAPPSPFIAPSANAALSSVSSEDIRDIRGPKFVFAGWLLPILFICAALLAVAAYGVWRRLRGERRPRDLLPFEVALQRLEAIRALLQPASAREFSVAVSDIVRSYIEQRFDVIATHRTTEEFLRGLVDASNASLARHRELLAQFLFQCDLVKFAGMSLTLQSMEALHESARVFVRETAQSGEATQNRQGATVTRHQGEHDSLPST